MNRLLRAGLLTAVVDGLFSSTLSVVFYHSTATRMLVQRAPTIGVRWWVQLLGHVPFVGMPIVASIGRPRSP